MTPLWPFGQPTLQPESPPLMQEYLCSRLLFQLPGRSVVLVPEKGLGASHRVGKRFCLGFPSNEKSAHSLNPTSYPGRPLLWALCWISEQDGQWTDRWCIWVNHGDFLWFKFVVVSEGRPCVSPGTSFSATEIAPSAPTHLQVFMDDPSEELQNNLLLSPSLFLNLRLKIVIFYAIHTYSWLKFYLLKTFYASAFSEYFPHVFHKVCTFLAPIKDFGTTSGTQEPTQTQTQTQKRLTVDLCKKLSEGRENSPQTLTLINEPIHTGVPALFQHQEGVLLHAVALLKLHSCLVHFLTLIHGSAEQDK